MVVTRISEGEVRAPTRAVPRPRNDVPDTSGLGRRVPLARRLVLRSRSRFALAVGTATAIVALIVLQLAVMMGMQDTTSWVGTTGADIWVTAAGEKPLTEGGAVPDGAADAIAAVDGVGSVVPVSIWGGNVVPDHSDPHNQLLLGWSPDSLDLDLVSGRMPAHTGEVVVDAGFARTFGLAPGDNVTLGSMGRDERATIVGTARGASLLIYQYVFTIPETITALETGDADGASNAGAAGDDLEQVAIDLRDAASLLRQNAQDMGFFGISRMLEGTADQLEVAASQSDASRQSIETLESALSPHEPAYLAIRVGQGADVDAVAHRIEGAASVDAYTEVGFRDEVNARTVGPFMPVFYVLVATAVLVGTLVLGMTLSTQVAESLNDYAMLRALGVSRARLRLTVLGQGAVVIGVALVLGISLGLLALSGIRRALPLLPVALEAPVFLIVVAAAAGMGILGTMLPIRRVQRVDPVAVFRA